MRALRQRFWLLVMDALHACGAWHTDGLRWQLFLWAVRKASDATDWGEGAFCLEERREVQAEQVAKR